MWKEFKAFVLRGNVMDLAVGVIIGASFGAVVKSLVDDLIMPPIGLLMGGADLNNRFAVLKDGTKAAPPYTTAAAAREAGAVTLNYGAFLGTVLAFLIVALAVFLMIRAVNKLYRKPAPETPNTKSCTFCTLSIPLAATRCPNCTAALSTG